MATSFQLETYDTESNVRIMGYDCEGKDLADACAILTEELRSYPEYAGREGWAVREDQHRPCAGLLHEHVGHVLSGLERFTVCMDCGTWSTGGIDWAWGHRFAKFDPDATPSVTLTREESAALRDGGRDERIANGEIMRGALLARGTTRRQRTEEMIARDRPLGLGPVG